MSLQQIVSQINEAIQNKNPEKAVELHEVLHKVAKTKEERHLVHETGNAVQRLVFAKYLGDI